MSPSKSVSIRVASVDTVDGHGREQRDDYLVIEEPLSIRVITGSGADRAEHPLAVTMRTPGNDEQLSVGLLFTEGIIASREDVVRTEATTVNEIIVELAASLTVDLERLRRNFVSSSSCGVCGKAFIDSVTNAGGRRITSGFGVPRSVIPTLADTVRERQQTFDYTGGLHAAALFDVAGNMLALFEDVGRHNAVDKLIGSQVIEGKTPLHERLVFLSGRIGYELVQKCVMAGVPVIAAVGAPTSLAIETARRFGVTVVGFARNSRFNIYTGTERIL